MKKNNKETTVATKNEVKVQTAAAVNEKASRAQLALIGKAVKDGKIERFTADAWKNMTKKEASQIITNGKLAEGLPASDAQKKKIKELVHAGCIKGMRYEKFKALTSDFAKKLIYKGMQVQQQNPDPVAA